MQPFLTHNHNKFYFSNPGGLEPVVSWFGSQVPAHFDMSKSHHYSSIQYV